MTKYQVLFLYCFPKVRPFLVLNLYKISIQNINYKTVSYCFAIGPCTNSWLPKTLNAPIYLDAFLLAFNISAVTVVNVPFFCLFLALVLLEEAATALGVVDTLALGVVDAAVALEDATGADAALALAFLAAIALEDAPGIALVASASTLEVVGAIGVNAVVGCTVEPPTLP